MVGIEVEVVVGVVVEVGVEVGVVVEVEVEVGIEVVVEVGVEVVVGVGVDMKYMAFYKGDPVDDDILQRVIDAARRGLITEAGKKLILIPDYRFGEASSSGIKEIENGQMIGKGSRAKKSRKIRKKDCIPLANLVIPRIES